LEKTVKTAIIGLPYSGKSTLVGAATGSVADPSAPPLVRRAIAKVPDERLDVLADMYRPKKVTEATIEYIDIPGFSLSDHRGQEELRRLLPEIRQADLIVAVVRAFENATVPPYRDRVDPDADLVELRDELVFTDLETVSKRAEKVEKALRRPTKTHDQEKHELDILERCKAALEDAKPLSDVINSEDDRRVLASFALLTQKPLLVVYNVSEDKAADPDPSPPESTTGAVRLSAQTELDIVQLDESDRPSFLADLGVSEPAANRLIQKCYQSLGLVSFLTAGEDEVRAWTIRQGDDAVTAASKIHSDIARGFIRAETVAYHDLVELGDMKAAKANGKVRQEGKTYIVQDGDIINFKFNV
jgi:ribosome-binding ATPase